MKMPELIYVGVCGEDADYVDPEGAVRSEVSYTASEAVGDSVAALSDMGYVAEYRLVRRLRVTKTVPEPILEVKEIDQ